MLSSLIGYYSLIFGLSISLLIIFFSVKNFNNLKILDSKILLFSLLQLVLVLVSFLSLVTSNLAAFALSKQESFKPLSL